MLQPGINLPNTFLLSFITVLLPLHEHIVINIKPFGLAVYNFVEVIARIQIKLTDFYLMKFSRQQKSQMNVLIFIYC